MMGQGGYLRTRSSASYYHSDSEENDVDDDVFMTSHSVPTSNVTTATCSDTGASIQPTNTHTNGSSHCLPGNQPHSNHDTAASTNSLPIAASPPSMHNGLATTVPQNIVQPDLNNAHRPTAKGPCCLATGDGGWNESGRCKVRCCQGRLCLVLLQLFLGIGISLLAFHMESLTSTFRFRDCPYWAGIPVSTSNALQEFHNYIKL